MPIHVTYAKSKEAFVDKVREVEVPLGVQKAPKYVSLYEDGGFRSALAMMFRYSLAWLDGDDAFEWVFTDHAIADDDGFVSYAGTLFGDLASRKLAAAYWLSR